MMDVSTATTATLAAAVAALGLVIYRLRLHPLSHFPGPAFAAFSGLFVFYHDVLLDGKLHLALERLHARYGLPHTPQARISPICLTN